MDMRYFQKYFNNEVPWFLAFLIVKYYWKFVRSSIWSKNKNYVLKQWCISCIKPLWLLFAEIKGSFTLLCSVQKMLGKNGHKNMSNKPNDF